MTGNQVNISVSTTDKNTENVLKRIERSVDKNEAKLEKLGRTGQKAGRKTKSGFDSALATFGKFTGAIAGVGGLVGGVALAANQVRVELANIKQLNKKDANAQVSFEDSLTAAFKNSSGLFEPEELKKIVLGIEEETGVSPAKIAAAISSAFSARGPKNKDQAQEAITATVAALQFSPKLPTNETADLTGAGIDLSKRFGFTPQEALGFLQNVGGQARVVEPAMLANNVTPAIANLASFGNTAQESGALVAALTQGATDKKAASTGTAAIALASQLKKRGIGESTAEGIDILASDPELRKRFLEGGKFDGKKFPAASFERTSETAIQQLFEEGSVTRNAFKEGVRVIGDKKEAQATFELMINAAREISPTSALRRKSESAVETAHIKDVQGGRTSEALDALNRSMDAANFGSARRHLINTEADIRFNNSDEDPRLIASEILKLERDRILKTGPLDSATFNFKQLDESIKGFNFLKGGFFQTRQVTEADISAKDRQAGEALTRQIEILLEAVQNSGAEKERRNEAVKAMQANTRAMEEQTKAIKSVKGNGASTGSSTAIPQVLPPPRRAPYKSPAEKLGVSRNR